MAKQKVLVSACLIGMNCKYNQKNNLNPSIVDFLKDKEVILICPEVMGGLLIPRLKSEIKDNKVINELGDDVTNYFELGANKALDLALKEKVTLAILKEKSPSCGTKFSYDGTFSNKLVNKPGVFTKKLMDHSIKILTENDFNGGNKK